MDDDKSRRSTHSTVISQGSGCCPSVVLEEDFQAPSVASANHGKQSTWGIREGCRSFTRSLSEYSLSRGRSRSRSAGSVASVNRKDRSLSQLRCPSPQDYIGSRASMEPRRLILSAGDVSDQQSFRIGYAVVETPSGLECMEVCVDNVNDDTQDRSVTDIARNDLFRHLKNIEEQCWKEDSQASKALHRALHSPTSDDPAEEETQRRRAYYQLARGNRVATRAIEAQTEACPPFTLMRGTDTCNFIAAYSAENNGVSFDPVYPGPDDASWERGNVWPAYRDEVYEGRVDWPSLA